MLIFHPTLLKDRAHLVHLWYACCTCCPGVQWCRVHRFKYILYSDAQLPSSLEASPITSGISFLSPQQIWPIISRSAFSRQGEQLLSHEKTVIPVSSSYLFMLFTLHLSSLQFLFEHLFMIYYSFIFTFIPLCSHILPTRVLRNPARKTGFWARVFAKTQE